MSRKKSVKLYEGSEDDVGTIKSKSKTTTIKKGKYAGKTRTTKSCYKIEKVPVEIKVPCPGSKPRKPRKKVTQTEKIKKLLNKLEDNVRIIKQNEARIPRMVEVQPQFVSTPTPESIYPVMGPFPGMKPKVIETVDVDHLEVPSITPSNIYSISGSKPLIHGTKKILTNTQPQFINISEAPRPRIVKLQGAPRKSRKKLLQESSQIPVGPALVNETEDYYVYSDGQIVYKKKPRSEPVYKYVESDDNDL